MLRFVSRHRFAWRGRLAGVGICRGLVAAALLAVVISIVAAPGVQAAVHVRHVWRVNLDGDAHVERVRLVDNGKSIFDQRSWLQVADRVAGSRLIVAVSPRIQFLRRRDVRIGDLNAHPRRPEIFYIGTTGGTAGSPTYAGIRNWDGHTTHRLFTYAPPYRVRRHNGQRYYYDGATIRITDLAAANNPAKELVVRQEQVSRTDPLCCPSYILIRDYRYSSTQRRWLAYHHRWKPT